MWAMQRFFVIMAVRTESFPLFVLGNFFMSEDDIFVKVADNKALNLSQNERMCIDDALTTVDNDDNFPCQDGDFVIKMV